MITKEQFVKIINRLRDYNDLQHNIQSLFDNCIDNRENDFTNAGSICVGHETIVVKLLENIFNDNYNNIEWWIYELDYGRRYIERCLTEQDGTIIDVSTPEKLYEYLIKEMEEKDYEENK